MYHTSCQNCEDYVKGTALCACDCHQLNDITKVVDGKEYKVHIPSDPAIENICDACE